MFGNGLHLTLFLQSCLRYGEGHMCLEMVFIKNSVPVS